MSSQNINRKLGTLYEQDDVVQEENEDIEMLFEIKNWRIDKFSKDKGSIIYHKICRRYTCILILDSPMCSEGCKGSSARIPKSIQTIYTMHNWNLIDDDTYFVRRKNEL